MERCHRCGSEITSGGCPSPTCQTTWHSVGMHLGAHIDPDPRDAEIAALKAELADTRAELGRTMLTGREIEHENNRLRRALAAGPAALRALRSDDYSPGYVAGVVEAAQEAAMKEGT